MSVYRSRGLKPVIDTTAQAEFDFAAIPVTPDAQERIGRNLLGVPYSERDVCIGSVRLRELEGLTVLFTVERTERAVRITLGGVFPTPADESTEAFLWRIVKSGLPEPARLLLRGRRKR